MNSIQETLVDFLYFLNDVLIPFLFAIAIVFIMWNLFRFFILKGATEEGQDQGKRLIIWGVAALVVMVSMWGIVKMGVQAFGVSRSSVPCPDYLPGCFGSSGFQGSGYYGTGSDGSGSPGKLDLLEPGKGIQR